MEVETRELSRQGPNGDALKLGAHKLVVHRSRVVTRPMTPLDPSNISDPERNFFESLLQSVNRVYVQTRDLRSPQVLYPGVTLAKP